MRRPLPYLLRRHETYYFRITIPKHLWPKFGRREVVHSLKTSEIGLARRQARIIANHMEELFDKVALMTNPTRQQIDAAIYALFQKLKEEQVDQLTLPRNMTSDDWRELIFQLRDDYQKTKEEHLVRGFDTPDVKPSIVARRKDAKVTTEDERLNNLMQVHNLSALTRESPDYRYAIVGMREAHEEIARMKIAKVAGDDTRELEPRGRFEIPAQPVAPTSRHTTIESSDISTVVEEFIAHKLNNGDWTEKTLVEYQPKLSKFSSFIKSAYQREHINISEITHRDLTEFQNLLKTSKPNKAKEGTTYSIESRRKHFSVLGMLFKYAQQRYYLDRSPYQPELFTEKARPRDKENYKSFEIEKLHKLFGSALFNERTIFKKKSDFWMPLLGLYTGARLGELAYLRVEDIRTENDVDYLEVKSTDERDIKNKWSQRKIPIHPALKEIGFLDYVAQCRKQKVKHLFPDLTSKAKNPQAAYSRRFSRLLKKLELKEDLIVYHSFRHTFITHMRRTTPRVSPEDIMAITGHSGDTVHSTYGERPPVWILAPEMAKLDYGLNWKELLKPQDKPKVTRTRKKSPYRKK